MRSVQTRALGDSGRERVKIKVWRGIALFTSAVCAYLLLAAKGPAQIVAVGDRASDERAQPSRADPERRRAARPTYAAALAHLLAQLDRAQSIPARCAALRRIARQPDLDELAIERIASYAGAAHPFELRSCAVAALGDSTSDASVAPLRALANDPLSPIMEAAIRALAHADSERARAAVLSLAQSGPRAVRVMGAIALAEAGAEQALPLLLDLLDHGQLYERERIVIALGTTRDPRALPVLKELLASGSRMLAHSAIMAMGELGGEGATETLLAVLRERPALAHSVTQALARTGDAAARKALLGAAEGESSVMAMAALQALTTVEGDDVRGIMLRALASRAGGARARRDRVLRRAR